MKRRSRNGDAPRLCARQDKPFVFILGTGEGSLHLLRSAKQSADAFLLQGRDDTQAVRKNSGSFAFDGDLCVFLSDNLCRLDKKTVYVIVNTGNDEENLYHCKRFATFLQEQKGAEYFFLITLCEGDMRPFSLLEEETGGRIRCVGRGEAAALDLESRYPLTSFLGEKELDFSRGELRPQVRMNVALVGLSEVNREVFLSCVSSECFFARTQAGRLERPVRYTCFDSAAEKESLENCFLRYARFLEQVRGKESGYLPLPPLPAELRFTEAGARSENFFPCLRAALEPGAGEIVCNRVVVAFGSDEENLEAGRQISEKLKAWGMYENTRIFVFARGAISDCDELILFGKDETVYDFENICGENLLRMAWERHLSYTAERCKGASAEQVRDAALSSWYAKGNSLSHKSSLYACLSLRSKLQLFGFDYVPKDSPLPDAAAEFYAVYTDGDAPRNAGQTADGRPLTEYRNADFDRDSARRAAAELEHSRWNAFMICNGYISSSLQQIRKENRGKNVAERRHVLTDFAGLTSYRALVSEYYGMSEEEADVIRYDYQLTDECGWLLSVCGYKIVKRCAAADAAVRGEEKR